jgi:phosphoribosylanthranilate isomerase
VRTRIKFCGLTRVEDVRAAADIGADALGFIFAAGSSRCLDFARFDALLAAVPVFVTPAALFRDNTPEEIAAVLARSPRLVAQFHGDEPPEFCASFARPWLKAVPMGALSDVALTGFLQGFADAGCAGFVFDSHGGAVAGGSGRRFDWARVPPNVPAPLVLAGGLSPDSVADAVRQVRPFAVDVSSGIESAPGIKDHAKMRRFADEVFRARTD